jgi:hypothetical protein
VGCLAYQAIRQELNASVIGSTLHGIFLLTPGKHVIFISYQAYRSPLTITLNNPTEKLRQVQPGMEARLSPDRIDIYAAGIEVTLAGTPTWTPPLPIEEPGSREECLQRLKQTIQLVVKANVEIGFGSFLLPLLDTEWAGVLPDEPPNLLTEIRRLEQALREGSPQKMLAILIQRLLGLGRGLTPSGDDFIMGLLLVVNRWPHLFGPLPGLAELNRQVVEKAYSITTSISANLIESATLGYGDERLISALDGIVTGSLSAEECAGNLLALGASSGVDALVGITAGVLYMIK